jgi:hypothetical protein
MWVQFLHAGPNMFDDIDPASLIFVGVLALVVAASSGIKLVKMIRDRFRK